MRSLADGRAIAFPGDSASVMCRAGVGTRPQDGQGKAPGEAWLAASPVPALSQQVFSNYTRCWKKAGTESFEFVAYSRGAPGQPAVCGARAVAALCSQWNGDFIL